MQRRNRKANWPTLAKWTWLSPPCKADLSTRAHPCTLAKIERHKRRIQSCDESERLCPGVQEFLFPFLLGAFIQMTRAGMTADYAQELLPCLPLPPLKREPFHPSNNIRQWQTSVGTWKGNPCIAQRQRRVQRATTTMASHLSKNKRREWRTSKG